MLMLLACTCPGMTAWGQAQPGTPATLQRVEITGGSGTDNSRDDAAARVVIGRDEIARYGDNSVTDVLRRVPGISIGGGQSRAADIRLRGLGNGYTQILVNGERMPAGFSLDSLSPGQIERIEVYRVATVDLGAQAIAGTIDIILRQSMRRGVREFKAGLTSQSGLTSGTVDALVSDRFERVSYSLGASLGRRKDAWLSTTRQQGTDTTGLVDAERLSARRAFGLARNISLNPKVAVQLGEADKVDIDLVLRRTRFDDHSTDERSASIGPAPQYSSDDKSLGLTTSYTQTRLHWARRLHDGAGLDLRAGTSLLRRDSISTLLGRDALRTLVMDERVTSGTSERGALLAGKLRLPWALGHAAAIGWDGERTVRDDQRSQRQFSPTGRPAVDLDEGYRSSVQRWAVYAQDEWDLSDDLSAYAGLRWASLGTRTEGPTIAPVANRAAVVSPVLQMLWKLPDTTGDQMRLGLSKTYRAPSTASLIPRRLVAIDNTPTTPDLQGNPDLRPELANGLDLAYEHALARQAGTLNLNVSARRIHNVILDQLSQEGGVWISRKANQGSARSISLEVDSTWRWRAVWADAPDVDMRSSVARNWSRVDRVPGPDNRLDSQTPLTANLGLDWRVASHPLTLGTNLAWRGGAFARTSTTQTSATNTLRTLDMYGLWAIDRSVHVRVALSNILHPHDITSDSQFDGTGRFQQSTDAVTSTAVRAAIEVKL